MKHQPRLIYILLSRLILGCLAISFTMALGCTSSSDETTPAGQGQTGSTNISLVLPRQVEVGPELSELSCVVLRVTAPDLRLPRGTAVAVPPGSASIELTIEVPAGADRRFEAEAFAEAEACDVEAISPSFTPNFIPLFQQRGDIVADITPSGITVVIPMEPVNGPVVRPPTLPEYTDSAQVAVQMIAFDPNSNPLTYGATGLPPGLRIDPVTGNITGTLPPNASAGSPYSVNVTVSNGSELDSVTFPWTITNPAPILTLPFRPVPNALEGATLSLQPEASDPDGDVLTFSAAALPPGLGIDPSTGLISGALTRTAAAGSPYTVVVTVSDGSAADSLDFDLTVTNPPPLLTTPGDQVSNEGEPVTLQLEANDPDGDPLTYSARGLPPGLGIDATTGLIAGTLTTTASSGSPYAVAIEITDGTDTRRVTFMWDVAAVIPEIGIIDRTTPENNAAGAVFTVSLSAATGRTVTVAYATANDTATAGQDYEAIRGTLTFAPGVTAQSLRVSILNDTLDEPTETFLLNLSAPTNATLADAQGVGTIQDDDATPTLVINNVTVAEGNSGGTNASFTVTLSAASGQAVTVSFATADGSAIAGQDYRASNGTLVFPPGTTSRPILVPVIDDTVDEPDQETFTVNLSAPINATLGKAQGIGVVQDDDAPPSIAINDVSVTEGNSGTTAANFVVTLSAVSNRVITINFATANNSAIATADYQPVSGVLTFPPGTTTQPIAVPVIGDAVGEINETFVVNLSNPVNTVVAVGQGLGTIVDDDLMMFVSSAEANQIWRYAAANGEFIDVFVGDDPKTLDIDETEGLQEPRALVLDQKRRLCVTSKKNHRVLCYDVDTGEPLGALAIDDPDTPYIDESGGLQEPSGMVMSTDGALYVASTATDEILRYDDTGKFHGIFVSFAPAAPTADTASNLQNDVSLTLTPEGRLYVLRTASKTISFYDIATGTPLGTLIGDSAKTPRTDLRNGPYDPAAMALGSDGWLYVSSFHSNEILRYNAMTGDFDGIVNLDAHGGLEVPGQLAIGPDKRLYVGSLTTNEVLRFDAETGVFFEVFIITGSSKSGEMTQSSLIFAQPDLAEPQRATPVEKADKAPQQ